MRRGSHCLRRRRVSLSVFPADAGRASRRRCRPNRHPVLFGYRGTLAVFREPLFLLSREIPAKKIAKVHFRKLGLKTKAVTTHLTVLVRDLPSLASGWRTSLCCDSFHADRDFPNKQKTSERRTGFVVCSGRTPPTTLEQTPRRPERAQSLGFPDLSICTTTQVLTTAGLRKPFPFVSYCAVISDLSVERFLRW